MINNEIRTTVLMTVGVFLISITIWIGRSYFEAKSYNNVTGKQVSTWDAMFLDLRIQEPVK